MNKVIKNTLIILFLGFYSACLWAKNFRIEVLVFHQNSPTSEVFQQAETELTWPKTIQQDFRDNILLQNAYFSLIANKAYQPVWYKSWVQSVASNRVSDAMPIKQQSNGDLLNGFVRVQRGHYLHLLIDLEYSPNNPIYRINEKRRIKLNEIHYFDHPKFGVIATVKPL